MKIYVIDYYVNTGWGTRINNYDKYIGCDITKEFTNAVELANKFTGKHEYSRRDGSWVFDADHKVAKVYKKEV